jgi:hypothetical protein
MTELPRWRRSSRSANTADCVELRHTMDAIRDSKNPTGPLLTADLGALLTEVKRGRFDR